MFRNGIYKVCYGPASIDDGPLEDALAVMRNGRLIGSDRHGCVFVGEPMCGVGPHETIRIQLTIPPGGELVTGFRAGQHGATLHLRGQFDPTLNVQTSMIDIEGERIALHVSYLGPLPD
jgi:hypothetical protein